ncbi:hypothetical protein BRC72_01005 [Halobacteriales archaeon QH_7_66_36]|nr:MAG: hypothetical protein BRC72_01005 [Halobacteriales archaeon QH_7_66_36]
MHFHHRPSHRPELSDRQRAVVEFLVLSGVTVRDDRAYPCLEVYSTAESAIRRVADELGWLANEPRRAKSADDVAARLNDRFEGYEFDPAECDDVWAVSTVPHPALGEYDDPTDVTRLHPFTGRLLAREAGVWRGLPLGSLHLDVRGFDVSGDHLRRLLRRMGVTTAEHEGEGYAKPDSTMRRRYHPSDDVLTLPHGEGVEFLKAVGLSIGDMTPDRPLTVREVVEGTY